LQSDIAARALQEKTGTPYQIVTVKTAGDRIRHRPLAEFGGKALFVKELEEALLAGDIDIAVHSLKDLPAELPPGLQLTAVLPRESPFDALVLPNGARALAAAPRIGTCSVRRAAHVLRVFSGAQILPLRGNVDTRLKRLDGGEFDALLLSHAGLTRLGQEHRATAVLDGAGWLPALAQGAIGIETRADDASTNAVVETLNDETSCLCVTCERAFQLGLGGSCRSPIAGLARKDGDLLRFHGEVIAPDGADQVEARFEVRLGGDFGRDLMVVRAQALAAGQALRPSAENWL